MSATPATPATPGRPRLVTAAFWCWVVAAVLLILGGLLAATGPLIPVFRGAGVLTAIAGLGLAFLAGRSRSGDDRFRRAALALALVIVILICLTAAFGRVHLITLAAIIPLIAGAVLITRPGAASPRRPGDGS